MKDEQQTQPKFMEEDRKIEYIKKWAYKVYVYEVSLAKHYITGNMIIQQKAFDSKTLHNYLIVDTELDDITISKLKNQFSQELFYGMKQWLEQGYYIQYIDHDDFNVRREDKKLFDTLSDYQKLGIVQKYYHYNLSNSKTLDSIASSILGLQSKDSGC